MKCAICGQEATCVGRYEGHGDPAPACDDCCGHGNEGGWCMPRQKWEEQRAGWCYRCEDWTVNGCGSRDECNQRAYEEEASREDGLSDHDRGECWGPGCCDECDSGGAWEYHENGDCGGELGGCPMCLEEAL